MNTAQRQFERLVHCLIDGVATDAERAELTRLSAAHPEWVTGVFDELTLDALLKWQTGNIVEELPFLEGSVTTLPPVHHSRRSIPLWTGLIAATILIATGLGAWRFAATAPVDPLIADIVHEQGVTWSADCTALAEEGAVHIGRLSSAEGEYTLQFRDGSTVRVVGPASLDIKSKMLVQLDRGQATANVPPGSIGFTITSALVDVVDQGTQFGISVGNEGTDVVVFDGKVDVKSNLVPSGDLKRLTQGDAIKVDQQGAIGRLADVRRDVDGRWWGGERSGPDGQVIASVSDNIHGGDGVTFACYQTTFEGLREDALAFSDSPHHQWNGLTAAGLPDFLRGADYIKTFNDYRYIESFEMRVELARPANLYILFDDRVEAPDWLKASFEDTGVDIGLDEGPWFAEVDGVFREVEVHATATGGGNSIDNIYSVWRRRCIDGGTISLGSVGESGNDGIGFSGQPGRAMYGVAATPLDEDRAIDDVSRSAQRALAN